MVTSLTTEIKSVNLTDFDEEAMRKVETIRYALVRKGDTMEVARTKMKDGSVFLDAYLGLLSENGLNLNFYHTRVSHPKDDIYYKLILERII